MVFQIRRCISGLLLGLALSGCGTHFPPNPLATPPDVAPTIRTSKVADESAVGNGGNETVAAFFHRAQSEMNDFPWERLGPADTSRFRDILARGKLTVVEAVPHLHETLRTRHLYYDANRHRKVDPFFYFLTDSRGFECVQRVVFDGDLMDWVLEIDTVRWESLRKWLDSVPSPLMALLELAARKGIIKPLLPLSPPDFLHTRYSSPRFFPVRVPSQTDSTVLAKIESLLSGRLVSWMKEREFPQLDSRETDEVLSLLQAKAISIKEYPARTLPGIPPYLPNRYVSGTQFAPMLDNLGNVVDARVVRDPRTREPFIQFDIRVWSSFFLKGEIATESMLVQLFHEVLRYAYFSGRLTKSDDNYAISSSFRIKEQLLPASIDKEKPFP